MLPRTYPDQYCSIAGTLEVVGDRWTLLVIREAFRGTSRFDDFLARIGLARTVLTDRLNRLGVEEELARAGAREGDAVTIGDVTFDWAPNLPAGTLTPWSASLSYTSISLAPAPMEARPPLAVT